MKKIFSFVLGLFAVTALQAANTEVARITITGQGGTEASNITLRVDPTVAADQTSSFLGATDEAGQVNIYAIKGTEKYSVIKSAEFENLELQVITNRRAAANQHYTLSFNVPTSTNGLTLYDRKTGTTTNITNGGSYEFDVNTTLHTDYVEGTNYTIVDRFIINYVAPAPVAPAICFNYNKLQLTKYDGATVEVFADGAATAALTQVVSGDAQFDIDLSTLASGKYKVVVSGIATPEEYIIDVKPAVTVVP